MNSENALDFYESLGFEEAEIEDGLTALFFETGEDSSYVLLTDEDGKLPVNLKAAIVLAYYSPEGAFQWSVSFKNSHLFKDIWTVSEKIEDKLTGALKYRDGNDYTN